MENTLCLIEDFYRKNKIDHRFVGGVSFGGLLTDKTNWHINIKKRQITLKKYHQLSGKRSDGTYKDIDIIILSNNYQLLPKILNHIPNTICVEHAIFYPKKINTLLQFVTAITTDKNNKPFFSFGPLHQSISWKSLEPWTVILNKKISYTVRNPIADYYAYQFRSPSGLKPKDIEKLSILKKLTEDIIKEGKKNNIDYMSEQYYLPWKIYVQRLQASQNFQISLKRSFMKIYWNTIGEYLAHGKGFSKYLGSLHNKFTGSKQ